MDYAKTLITDMIPYAAQCALMTFRSQKETVGTRNGENYIKLSNAGGTEERKGLDAELQRSRG